VRGLIADGRSKQRLSFRQINRSDLPDYDSNLQRHHILPRQIVSGRCFGRFLRGIGLDGVGFDDFRRNGLLLPCREPAAMRLDLPLHRGPHRQYNAMVMERLGRIEADWSHRRICFSRNARFDALMRIRLLQSALRRVLLRQSRLRLKLHRRDVTLPHHDFSELDAMADTIWHATRLAHARVTAASDPMA
jgi:hypothetical protein